MTDPNHLLWNRQLSQGKTSAPGFVLLPVPTAAFGLAVLLCASLLFYWMVQQGAHKGTKEKSINTEYWWVLRPFIILPPTAQPSIQTIYSLAVWLRPAIRRNTGGRAAWIMRYPVRYGQLNCGRSLPVIRKGRGQRSVPLPALTALLRRAMLEMVLPWWVVQGQIFMKLARKV